MRKNIFWSAILALSMPLSLLISCQSDDEFVSGKQEGKGASISLDVNYPEFGGNTRTSLEEIEGDMVGNWAEGDKLLITDASGNNVGSLELTDGAGTKHATFTGNLSSNVQNGSHEFTFTYLGAGVQIDEISSSTYNLDFSSQDGDYTELNRYDVFSGKGRYTVVNGTSYAEEALQFKKLLALAHFELIFPDGVSLTGENVEISGTNLKNSVDIDLTNGALKNPTNNNIIVSGTNGDFYITMIPSEDVTPTFSVNINGTEYESTLGMRTWTAGEFVRQAYKKGVPVKMEAKEDETEIKFIDLGLPSGILWADRNLGANTKYEYGKLIGWGDVTMEKTSTQTKDYPCPYNMNSYYLEKNYYKNCTGDTRYDVVAYQLGSEYYTPDMDDWNELFNNCSGCFETLTDKDNNSINVLKLTSDINHEVLYLPLSGNRSGNNITNRGVKGYYWSAVFCLWFGSQYHEKSGVYYFFKEKDGDTVQESNYYTPMGMSIRPIKYGK